MTEPFVAVNKRGAERLRSGLPWVYRQDVARPAEAEGGSIARITDERGNVIGRGFWAAKSQVAVRIITRGDEPCDASTLVRRVQQAVDRRRRLFPTADAFRAIHGEADLVPGLFADVYGDGLAVQLLSEGADHHRDVLLGALTDALKPRVVALRNDTSAREFEFLERSNVLVSGDDSRCRYHEGENVFEVDLMKERKTGGFLDQRENHLRAAEYAKGDALDTFSYHGGFALALARRAKSVLAIDEDPEAAATARANAERNGLANVEVLAANAFDALHEYDRTSRTFDTIVIDPPALAKRKEGVPSAMRAYRELNLRALRILRPGGVLVSCSCSAKVTPAMFEEMLLEAARDARRPVQILERRGAGRDHPGLMGVAETEYLKCFVLQTIET